jgi:hypothetical protein
MTFKSDLLTDLATFINITEFADTATHVLTAATFPVIFDAAYVGIIGPSGEIQSSGPQAQAKTSDVEDYAIGDEIMINAIYYKIAGMEPDGTGITRILLSERTEVAVP